MVPLRAVRSGRARLELIQSPNELREGGVRLASLELGVRSGEELRLTCEISASGCLEAELRRDTGERVEIPLFPKGNGSPRDVAAESARRMQELKLALAAVETALSEQQQDRLHALMRRIEGMPFDAETMALMEGLVKDLDNAVS